MQSKRKKSKEKIKSTKKKKEEKIVYSKEKKEIHKEIIPIRSINNISNILLPFNV